MEIKYFGYVFGPFGGDGDNPVFSEVFIKKRGLPGAKSMSKSMGASFCNGCERHVNMVPILKVGNPLVSNFHFKQEVIHI